ncbi:MAG: 4-hydroxybenzoate octaprenyltransferase [Nitrospiraceae bacterium]|nr:4-hydroxybenzoate octaprenyltransferase [Nitrospiraceae bacterium]
MRPTLASRIPWSALARVIRLQNQTGTYLLVLPTLWTLVLATGGWPAPRLVAIFLAGSFLMRSAGVILNDLADRSFDRQVARTKTRPLASGELSQGQAVILLGILLLSACGLLLFLEPSVWPLAPMALGLAALYPFSKRWIHVPQAVLGVAFGWGTIMAWAAVQGRVAGPVWLVFGATAMWAIAYDTIYALQDLEDDRRIGVKSAALFFGSSTWIAVATALGTMMILLATAGWMTGIGWPYYTVLLTVSIFFAIQVERLRQPISAPQAFSMFRAHMWAGAAILAGLLAGFVV